MLDQLQPSLPSVFVNPIVEGTASSFPFLNDLLAKADPRDPLEYIRVPFNHPLVIVYSSGTSGLCALSGFCSYGEGAGYVEVVAVRMAPVQHEAGRSSPRRRPQHDACNHCEFLVMGILPLRVASGALPWLR